MNAARIYGVDPDAVRCQVNSCQTAAIKRHMDGELGPRRWAFRRPGGPASWREYVQHVREAAFNGRPG